jgi:hypothetical protein
VGRQEICQAGAFRDLAYARNPSRPKPWSCQNKSRWRCDGRGKLLLRHSKGSLPPAGTVQSLIFSVSLPKLGKKSLKRLSRRKQYNYSLNPQSNSAIHMKALNLAVGGKEKKSAPRLTDRLFNQDAELVPSMPHHDGGRAETLPVRQRLPDIQTDVSNCFTAPAGLPRNSLRSGGC